MAEKKLEKINEVTLTQAAPESDEFILDGTSGSLIVFVIAEDSVFGGASIKIKRWVSEHTGWVFVTDSTLDDDQVFTAPTASATLETFIRTGKFKLVLDPLTVTANANIKVDVVN